MYINLLINIGVGIIGYVPFPYPSCDKSSLGRNEKIKVLKSIVTNFRIIKAEQAWVQSLNLISGSYPCHTSLMIIFLAGI